MHTLLKSKIARWAGPAAVAWAVAANACSGKVTSDTDGLGAAPGVGGATTSAGFGASTTGGSSTAGLGGSSTIAVGGGTAAQGGTTPLIELGDGAGGEAENGGNGGAAGADSNVCATVNASAKLKPVYLAFAFDVSGSMGNLGLPWYDPTLKWEPAVEATRAFLEDETSKGLFASLTTFPIQAETETERCDADNYGEPDVPMTELPSSKFGERLDAIRETYWGNGTPTRAVIDAVSSFVADYRESHPGHYAVVLVTDGYPQDCGDVNTIPAIEDAVSATADEVPTYVIGVKNPPLEDDDGTMAPDTVSDLNGVADAGGTEKAFIIDTGNPQKTRTDFRKAVDAIRGAAIACSLPIPAPPDDRTFQKDHVIVSTTEGKDATDLVYDEDCEDDGAWHYDSKSKPTQVVLCPDTCSRLQDAAQAKLQVGFTCEQVITVR